MNDRRRIVIVACLLLAVATVVAATSSGLEWRDTTTVAERETPASPDPATGGGDERDTLPTPADPAGDREKGSFRLTLAGVISALLLLAAAVLAVAVVARLRLVLRRRRRRDDTGLRGPPGVPMVVEPYGEEVARVIDQQVEAIAHGSPRNAIVAAWVALEHAAEHAGVPRFPTDTSTELAARTLGSHVIDPAAMDRLAALYREARFSPHELTERHRASARECLERLRAQLRGAAR